MNDPCKLERGPIRRLLLIVPALPPPYTPEAEYAVRLINELAGRNVDVCIATRGGRPIDAAGLRATVHAPVRSWGWRDLSRLADVVRASRPDAALLHFVSWGYGHHPMVTFIPRLLCKLAPQARRITLFENTIGVPALELPMHLRLGRRFATTWAGRAGLDYTFGALLRDSDSVIVLSEVHRHQLAERSPESAAKLVLLPPPPSVPSADDAPGVRGRTRQRLGIAESSFVVTCVGYVYPDKGIDALLQVLARLLQRTPNVHLIVVRVAHHPSLSPEPGYAAAMAARATELVGQRHVTWEEDVSWGSREVLEHLAAADACILPHDYGVQLNHRGFAAAAVQGLPTIAVRGRIPEALLRDGEHLLLCPSGKPEALAEAAIELMNSAELRERLGGGARDLARACYRWDLLAERIEAMAFGEGASAGVAT